MTSKIHQNHIINFSLLKVDYKLIENANFKKYATANMDMDVSILTNIY